MPLTLLVAASLPLLLRAAKPDHALFRRDSDSVIENSAHVNHPTQTHTLFGDPWQPGRAI